MKQETIVIEKKKNAKEEVDWELIDQIVESLTEFAEGKGRRVA
jgi:hypothetical protein